jgi:hypothetical protein
MASGPQTGDRFSLILLWGKTRTMQLFLNELSQEYQDYWVVIQLKQASFHKTPKLALPENIRLVFQLT